MGKTDDSRTLRRLGIGIEGHEPRTAVAEGLANLGDDGGLGASSAHPAVEGPLQGDERRVAGLGRDRSFAGHHRDEGERLAPAGEFGGEVEQLPAHGR